jgi:hypothetical protein
MPVANCPSCGGPIDFAIGSSVVVICDYCHTVVARTDVGLEDLGKVATLIDTGSPLRRDLPGKYHGTGFRLVGRTQMRHEQGGVWDEWYAAFDDGRWGWLAEAQGKYYITFTVANGEPLPQYEKIVVGQTIAGMVVQEIGSATLISGEGEIPWRVVPGDTYDYADLSGAEGRFGTVDYSEIEPLLFKGQETSLKELGIDIHLEPRRSTRIKVEKLSCSNCGGALNLVAPDQSERIVCPNCGGIHDVTSEGNLRYLEALRQKGPAPLIPLGGHGKIGDTDYVVAGFMQRSVSYDQKYYWTEYLLFNPNAGFRWLVDSDDHWSFVEPIAAGDVVDSTRGTPALAKTLVYKGTTFRVYSDAPARVEFVAGEFYWKVTVGEVVRATDYIAPPDGISKESSGTKKEQEVNYSLAHYMTVPEIEAAFDVKGLPRPHKVGMLQPYTGKGVGGIWAKLVAALFAVALILAVTRPRHEVFSQLYDFASLPAPAEPSAKNTRVVFTQPFQLSGKNLEVEGFSQLNNTWVYVGGDIINEQTGLLDGFELPIEYWEGYDGGEHWTEGSRSHKTFLSALPKGQYSMRLEAQWDEKTTPPPVMITVKEGVFRWTHFFLAFFLITIPTFFLSLRRGKFEAARWADASYTPAGTERDDD